MGDDGEYAGGAGGSFSAHSSRDKAFEIFVKRTITSIQKEAWGRSKEVKEIREACQAFLNSLDQTGCTEETLKQVLYPLQLACASNMQKVVELALACLHKLVAHAWLHGESTAAGTMDILSAHGSLDDDDTVANVIKMVIKCGETTNEALQLAVVRALLTFTTAEHFIAHGECLLSAVRAVFNLALGAENPINKRTASNALLQMLNTICKRVTQIQPRLTSGSSECSSRTVSEALDLYYNVPGAGFHGHSSPHSAKGSGTQLDHLAAAVMSPQVPGAGLQGGQLPYQMSDAGGPAAFNPDALTAAAGDAAELPVSVGASNGGRASSSSTASTAAAAAAARAAQLAELAEKKDLQGLEAALEAAAAADEADDGEEEETAELRTSATAAVVSAGLQSLSASAGAGGSSAGGAPSAADASAGGAGVNGTAAQQPLASAVPAQQQLQSQSSVGPVGGSLYSQPSWQQQQQQQPYYHGRLSGTHSYAGRPGRHAHRLTTQEKDVLLVLTAFCKLASREVPGGTASSDSVLAQGKLLALEMLAKVLSNPMHNWDHVPESFCRQLRQPLCMALLRNCATPDAAAYGLALKLLMAILNLPRIRLGLRAELGAFYPLLVLRYLEQLQAYLASTSAAAQQQQQQQQVQPPDPGNVAAALSALHSLLADPQLLVDLYVNFDCDLQAANLFERTVQVLSGLAGMSDGELEAGRGDKRSQEAVAGYVAVRKEALSCCLQVIAALESWAKPIKDAALRAIESNQATPGGSQGGSGLGFLQRDSASSLTPGGGSAPSLSEAERLAAAKSTKELLAKGITLFNTKGPLKGIESLIGNGLLEGSPAAVAAFLRTQQDNLDKAQLGELLGHHEDFAIAVMHAWVDSEPSMTGQAIDQSLRRLLGGFRLPGEAQKIDRIMEKFAERYCKDNPSRFHNADSAYMLSFSIIMLNTDAHNPLAERRLTKADFAAMNHTPSSEEGGMVPVLPVQQLEEIYDRVVRDEILVLGETRNNNFSTSRTTNRNRLAAAMGWTTVLQPFKVLAGGNNKSGAGKDAHAQRRYLQELAEREVVRAAASGNLWYCASHPEHVRPMLQVGFPVLLQALSAAFTSAPDAATAARLLAGLLQLTRLCGLLGLDRQCEAAVGVLAARSGVFDPAAPGTLAEAKQLSALQSLLSLTSGPEAGFLGSSWVIILRAISALDALKQELTRPPPVPVAPTTKEAPANASNPFSRMFQSMFGSTGGKDPSSPTASAGGATRGAGDPGHAAAAPAGGLQGAAVGSLGGMRDSSDGGGQKAALAVRDAPGAGLVLWAESAAGAMELERPYTYSTSLDGDAIVVFMRALCAVSQEELEAGSSSTAASAAAVGGSAVAGVGAAAGRGGPGPGNAAGGPRLYSLQKVVECAYHNMDRIRLVWGKLWAVIAAQLVGASCHPNRRIALYAVDSLRQLVGKLLARAELEHFTHQEEALRPFVAVLRQCDEACVRELAVQCVMQAVTSHAGGLGSGWRMVILALRLGAADGSPPVMAQTQEALQVVVETLYASSPSSAAEAGGHSNSHSFLRETVQAIVAGIRNPAHLELSISAVQLLGGCGARLAAYEDAGGKEEAPAAAVAAAPGGVDLDGDYGWGLLLRTLADVLQHDRRPAVVDASLEMVFGLLASYSSRWDAAAWRVLTQRVVRHMLSLPPGLSPPAPQAALDSLSGAAPLPGKQPGSHTEATSRLAVGSGTGFGSPVGAPGGAVGAGGVSAGLPGAAFGVLQQLGGPGGGGGAGGAVQVGMSVAEQGLLMTTMLKRMDRYYPLLCDQAAHIRAEYKMDMVQQLVAIGVAWYQQNSVYLSTAGIKALMRLAHTFAAGSTAHASWQLFVGPITTAVQADVQQILALATKQLAEQSAAGGGGADAAAAATRSSADSLTGSPRSRPAAAGAAGTPQGVGVPSPLGAGASAAAASAAAAAKGGMAARQAAAAAAAAAAVAAHLRVRSRQLVLLQRGLAEIHRDCRASMSWEEQMQLLDALGLGVDAAIAFNTDLSVAQQQRQQQQLLQAASANAQQQQQPHQQGLQAVPEGRSVVGAAGHGLLHDSISLASAVAPDGMHSSPGGAAHGEPLLPFGSSIRFSELSQSQKSSTAGGSAAGSAAVSSAGGSAAGAAGAAAAPGSDGGAAGAAGAADPFFSMRTGSASGGNSAGGGGALLLSRSTSAGSSDAAHRTGSHGGGALGSSNGGDAAGGGGAAGGGIDPPVGPAVSSGFGSVGGAVGSGDWAAQPQQQQQDQQAPSQKPSEPEITPLSPTSPSPQPQQQQQEPPQQQQQQQRDHERPNLPPVRTSHPGHQPEATPGSSSSTPGGGGRGGNSSPGGSPGRQRWSGGGGSGSPGRTRMGALVLPQLVVSSPESIEVVQPALMRLEAEGGLLLIEALTVSLESAPAPSPATQAARQRLLQLVRCIIQSEAASSSVTPYSFSHGRAGAVAGGAWDSSSSARAAAKQLDNPLQDALAGVGWEHAARAPLVVAALQVLSELQGGEYSSEVLALFPSLCRLMCSSHQLIRQGLAKVLGSGEFLGLLPAAAGAAAALGGVGAGTPQQEHSQQQWQQVVL